MFYKSSYNLTTVKTLKTDINTTYDIHNILINHNGPLISESGIKNKEDVLKIASETKIKTFLIGCLLYTSDAADE